MFAVIEAQGHQYKVERGQKLILDRLPGEQGSQVVFDKVLMLQDGETVEFGAPLLSSVSVKAKIEEHSRSRKLLVFKYKRRKNYKKTFGHRSSQTVVSIEDIVTK